MKPQPAILTIWRLILVFAAIFPAFFVSLFLRIGGRAWMLSVGLWLLCFLFFYLYYLPLRYKKLSYVLRDGQLTVNSGILYTRVRVMPLQNIQYAGLIVSPLDAIWGLAAVAVIAPGGRLLLPGLLRADAEKLAAALPE